MHISKLYSPNLINNLDMPHPTQVVALLKAQKIQHVRLFYADHAMLIPLAKTGIEVVVTVPNDELLAIGQSNFTAANWISHTVVAHYPPTNIIATNIH
ncbi:putative glucan endo-1,3-beta-D-glucosidase [Lupinus albus]|uniref:glucan endo-1,3-beta-D-glucosidase n=1 Tax=Lupinus albus TaxID=3870 RepID=A0A6A4PXD9_LUPAL|nr:putative glucan endo-1,3-beta-D-glucosidase [Lupinus albus]